MSVETATYISQLNPAYPAAGDPKSEGDDHLRLVKTVLQGQFPNLGANAVTATAASLSNAANKAGDTYTGTHNFSGATAVTVPTPGASVSDSQAATTQWVKNAIGGSVVGQSSTIRETKTATAGQTVFTLTNTYTPGGNFITIYINGVRQFPSAYTETSSNVVTFSSGLSAGDVVLFEIGVITSGTAVAASAVTFSPITGVAGPTVQDAITQLKSGISGAGGQTVTGNLTLTSTSGAAITATPSTYGLYVTLPDATTCSKADNLFAIYNAGDYDYGVKDSTGTKLGWIRPKSGAMVGLSDNSTAAGTWAYYGLEKLGTTALYSNASAPAVGGQALVFRTVALDANRTCYLFGNGQLIAVVYDSSTQTWGTATVVEAGNVMLSSSGGTVAAVLSATDQVLCAFHTATTTLTVLTLSISGTTITVNSGTKATKTTTTIGSQVYEQMVAVNGSFALGYSTNTAAAVMVLITVSGTTPTIGAETSVLSSGNRVVMFVSGTVLRTVAQDTSQVKIIPWTISGVTPTSGTPATVASNASTSGRFFMNGNGNIVCHYINSGGAHAATIFKLTGTTEAASTVVLGSSPASTVAGDADYWNVTSSKTVFITRIGTLVEANILTDTAGTASVGTAISVKHHSASVASISAASCVGNTFRFLSASNSIVQLTSIDCSGASPVYTSAVRVMRLNSAAIPYFYASDKYGARHPWLLSIGSNVLHYGGQQSALDVSVNGDYVRHSINPMLTDAQQAIWNGYFNRVSANKVAQFSTLGNQDVGFLIIEKELAA